MQLLYLICTNSYPYLDDDSPIYETIMDEKLGSPSLPTDDAIQMRKETGAYLGQSDMYQYQPYPMTTGAPPGSHNMHGTQSSKYDVLGQTPVQAGYTGISQEKVGNSGTQPNQSGHIGTASDQEGYMVPSLHPSDYKGNSCDEPGYTGLSIITSGNNNSLPYKVSLSRFCKPSLEFNFKKTSCSYIYY